MQMLHTTAEYLQDFLSLLFPHNCEACMQPLAKGEDTLCIFCRYELPETNFHLQRNNQVEQLFWGRAEIEKAAALFFFTEKTKVQRLLHQLKYHGKKEIGEKLGRIYGEILKDSDFIKDIDLIVPVPLHEKRKRQRGYNQSDYFARGLSESLSIPWSDKILKRKIYTNTQTGKNRYERWGNVGEVFQLHPRADIAGARILLVDDILTTGSTLEACAHSLLSAANVKVSIATIAVAR